MPLPMPLNVFLEQTIEVLLKLDPETRERLETLDGKLIRVNVTSPPMSVTVSVTDGRVYVVADATEVADTTISGSLAALRSLPGGNEALYRGEVTLEGDLGAGQELKQIIAGIDPDWEELVSPLVGDTLAYRLGTAGRHLGAWLERTRSSLQQNTSEYLQEEAELLAPNSEVRDFCNQIDDVRARADRLEARLRKLERATARDAT
ncbi:ubiquinone biosynthesis accessory factor UbiJ [Granulosicoccus antarcticus]|uniref:Ubiquinone biosynthesis accessory factor UbiJ n=1 Tax=Granulosicoccus antarcticus IMCC3135 TaxID=1192854 RepID=A0A2Z2NGG5_9GAMM|nr:SCP2 sterol-binding domain-containing protein [Granulosicoccus antarcticus]ASJ70153.1 hypothetical protein IMCC3135_00110 [Granulosicoccus antarcticus IMCC3135]